MSEEKINRENSNCVDCSNWDEINKLQKTGVILIEAITNLNSLISSQKLEIFELKSLLNN